MNIEAIGGRKFVLAVLTLVALVALAAADSSILTTEVIVAILGVLATYSGSNSFLTAVAAKIGTAQPAAAPQASEELGGEIQYVDSKANEATSRIERVEKDLGELIQIVAQLQEVVLTRLPSADTMIETAKVGTDDNAKREQAAQNRKALSAGI